MASKSYQASETSTTWTDSGGDKLLDLGGLAVSGGIAVGAYLDLGSSPRPNWYEVVLHIDGYEAAPAVGDLVELWFTQSNAVTGFDGQLTADPTSSAEGTATPDQAENTLFCRAVKAVSTTATDELQGRCFIKLTGRYVAPIVVNWSLTRALASSGDSHSIVLTPAPQEGQ